VFFLHLAQYERDQETGVCVCVCVVVRMTPQDGEIIAFAAFSFRAGGCHQMTDLLPSQSSQCTTATPPTRAILHFLSTVSSPVQTRVASQSTLSQRRKCTTGTESCLLVRAFRGGVVPIWFRSIKCWLTWQLARI